MTVSAWWFGGERICWGFGSQKRRRLDCCVFVCGEGGCDFWFLICDEDEWWLIDIFGFAVKRIWFVRKKKLAVFHELAVGMGFLLTSSCAT